MRFMRKAFRLNGFQVVNSSQTLMMPFSMRWRYPRRMLIW